MHENPSALAHCIPAKGGIAGMFGKKKRPPIRHSIQRLCELSHQSEESNSDVLGSYTGTPKEGVEPVQDADDL